MNYDSSVLCHDCSEDIPACAVDAEQTVYGDYINVDYRVEAPATQIPGKCEVCGLSYNFICGPCVQLRALTLVVTP